MNPHLLALMTMMAGGPNWREFARMADASNLPLPGSSEWEGLTNPGAEGDLGLTLTQDTGAGAFARPDMQLPGSTDVPVTRPLPGPPPADTGNVPGITTGAMPPGLGGGDTSGLAGAEGNLLDFLTGRGSGPGNPPSPELEGIGDAFGDTGAPPPSAFTPPGRGAGPGTERALGTNTGNRRFPNVRMPEQTRPEFRGGVAGAQKAPDMGVKAGASPAQALLAVLLGGQGKNPLRVPALGSLFGGGLGG